MMTKRKLALFLTLLLLSMSVLPVSAHHGNGHGGHHRRIAYSSACQNAQTAAAGSACGNYCDGDLNGVCDNCLYANADCVCPWYTDGDGDGSCDGCGYGSDECICVRTP